MKPGSKYYPLYLQLDQCKGEAVVLSIADIEACIQGNLPATARQKSSWWANRNKGGYQSQAWIKAGYHVDQVDLEQQQISFKRFQSEYKIQRVEGAIAWDAAAIRALRLHMKLTQARFAESLGVRRQTISEWENGAYLPDRSTTKHLGLVAEKEAFQPAEYYVPPLEDED
ncbi:MAG: helix-turn-helix transcriptional regulator [Leptolyngbyaceae cyanobacterium]